MFYLILLHTNVYQTQLQYHYKLEYHHNQGFFKDQALNISIEKYNTAIAKGILKVMNKIGISTLHSYRGAQIFEALGLRENFTKKYFSNTPSRIQGVGLYVIEKELSIRHKKAFEKQNSFTNLEIGRELYWCCIYNSTALFVFYSNCHVQICFMTTSFLHCHIFDEYFNPVY